MELAVHAQCLLDGFSCSRPRTAARAECAPPGRHPSDSFLSYADSHSDPFSYVYPNADTNTYDYSHPDGVTYGDCYTDTDTHTYCYSHPDADKDADSHTDSNADRDVFGLAFLDGA